MPSEDVRIELNGFDTAGHFAVFLRNIVEKLHYEAPSDALTTASFTRFNTLVTGAIQIASLVGVFSAKAQGKNAQNVTFKVVRDIRRQLKRWKRSRWREGIQSDLGAAENVTN